MKLKQRTLVSSGMLWVYSSFTLFILLYMTYNSLRTKKDLLSNTFGLPEKLTFSTYHKLFAEAHFLRYFFNSALILGVSLLLVVFLSSMVAYGLGLFKFRFKNMLTLYFLIGLMFPIQLGIVPIFLLIRGMGLLVSMLRSF